MSSLNINDMESPISLDRLQKQGKMITEKLSDNSELIQNNIIKNIVPDTINDNISNIIKTPIITSNNKISIKKILWYILITTIILILSYNLYLYKYENTNIYRKHIRKYIYGNESNADLYELNNDDDNSNNKKVVNNVKDTKLDKVINKPIYKIDKSYKPKPVDILGHSKKKWCYLGMDRGHRSCVKINDNMCMSGEIFPRKDICINPNLRIN